MTMTSEKTLQARREDSQGRASGAGRGLDYDAVVLGAGFSGLRMLVELKNRGYSARLIDAGEEVGGTWYWNTYPGARTDSQAWVYSFNDEKLREQWEWKERYATQSQVFEYLNLVVDRFDLKDDLQLGTTVTAAHYNDEDSSWQIQTDKEETLTTKYFFSAAGQLSMPYIPHFEGIENFAGEVISTTRWPDGVDLEGKRVAIIGTGATAVQVAPLVAKEAGHLSVFQRTPNYVLPSRNDPLSELDMRVIRRDYDEIYARTRQQPFGMDIQVAGRNADDCTPEEQQRILERAWEIGGFKFLFETFDDLLTSAETNELAAEFVRSKIRSIVNDPETAELLTPKDYPLAHKRPPLGHLYYETFNRDNVSLVDISATGISRIEAQGVRVGEELHEADVIILATGYDAITGTMAKIDIRGRGGAKLIDKWADGPNTFLGMMIDEFPNMFMIAGAQSPFANIPVVSQLNSEWLGGLLAEMESRGVDSVEPTAESVANFSALNQAVLDATVLGNGDKGSWYLGTNIPGKAKSPVMWLGGVGTYVDECTAEESSDYASLQFWNAGQFARPSIKKSA